MSTVFAFFVWLLTTVNTALVTDGVTTTQPSPPPPIATVAPGSNGFNNGF